MKIQPFIETDADEGYKKIPLIVGKMGKQKIAEVKSFAKE